MRILRPLRMVSRLQGMKIVVDVLVSSLPLIANAMAFGLFLFTIFGILGVQLFAGKFHLCNDACVPPCCSSPSFSLSFLIPALGRC
jgi:hypothetical protein